MKFIEKVLNIAEHETSRTAYAWSLLFLHKFGLIIGTTTLIALFVTKFGISNLPFMILLQAILTIAGMFAFSFLNEHFSSKKLIPICSFATGLTLFIATFFLDQPYVFFGLLLMVTGIFLPQLTIFLSNYIEDFFTPLECERTFPVIESAQTIGGIFAGLLITTLSAYIGSYKFFYLWILFLFLVVSVIFFLEPLSSEQQHIFHSQELTKRNFRSRVKKIKESVENIKLVPFLQGMLVIFLLHWIVAHVLEFQYTKLIDESIEATGGAHEEGLAHGLGTFHILFHGSALFVQLLVASRILRKIGTVGSFLLHALVTFFSSVSLMLGFGYFTVILAKNNFEISGILHKNAYEASYYALKHGTQRQVREFFEAFVYPVGTIIGTIIVLFVQFFFLETHTFLSLEIVLIALTAAMIFFTVRLQHSYTQLSRDTLMKSDHHQAKFHAIEILSQKGHQNHLTALISTLRNPREVVSVKVKILEMFQRIADPKTIPVLLDFLHDREEDIAEAAVKALGGFTKLGDNIFDQGFSRYRVINELKELFTKSGSEKVCEAVIHALAALKYEKIVPFLLDAMNGASERLHIASIQVSGLFHDPAIVDFLLPGLRSRSPFIRAETVLSLWQFAPYRNKLSSVLMSLYGSSKRDDFLAYCSVIGDIGDRRDIVRLREHLDVLDPVQKFSVSYALYKLGDHSALTHLVHLLFSRNSLVLQKANALFHSLKPDQKAFLQNIVRREVSQRLQQIFSSENESCESAEDIVQRCKEAYYILDLNAEAEQIHNVLTLSRNPVFAT